MILGGGGTGSGDGNTIPTTPVVGIKNENEPCNPPPNGDLNGDCILDYYEACLLNGYSQEVCECASAGESIAVCTILNCLGSGFNAQIALLGVQSQVGIADYLDQNQCSEEAKAVFIEALENLSSYTEISYPGMELDYEFEWWLDDDFVEDNFNFGFDVGGGLDNLTAEEKVLVALFPAQALIIMGNKEPAETETENRFGNNGINNKSDAFRHAFFNAMNSNDAGDFVARKFSNAHESETPQNLILEKQMDLHNNNIGHNIGNNASTFISDQELSNLVYQSLIWGSLRYLFPINYGDPNFWDDPTTPEPNDGDHGITSSTQLIQTNQ